jgi:hypothetical protein
MKISEGGWDQPDFLGNVRHAANGTDINNKPGARSGFCVFASEARD